MKDVRFILLCLIIFAVASCKKKDSCSTETWHYNVTGDTIVPAGDTIHLKATNVPNASFSWTGPNGFTSSSQEIFVPADNLNTAGIYTVRYFTADGCINHSESKNVKVGAPIAPCLPTANWIQFGSQSEPMGATYSNDVLSANSIDADMTMTFETTPVTGVYQVVDLGTSTFDMQPNQVTISISDFDYFGASAGSLVYVDVENGKITVSFCNILFSSYYGNAQGTVSVTCNL